ncbi:MAG: GNAT family N-acetyltransferase [Crenarchaeota archaeon]|nr:GNAT family N-acetyltransferase [Thermoproteota archaeon]
MNVIIKELADTNITYEQIVDLIHRSFEERLDQNLLFTCLFIDVDSFKVKTSLGIIFVALNAVSNELLGTAYIQLKKDKNNDAYGYFEYLAIDPKVKRMGVGTKLCKSCYDFVIAAGASYILCDTDVQAKSSINIHLKNGFRIIGLRSYPSTNYYSYLFRKQLKKSKKWDNIFYIKLIFIESYFKTKLTLKKSGEPTVLLSFYRWLKKHV